MVATTAYHMSPGMAGWLRRVSSSRGVRAVGMFPDIVVWWWWRGRDCDESFRNLQGGGYFPPYPLSGCAVRTSQSVYLVVFRQAPGAWDIQALPAINQTRTAL